MKGVLGSFGRAFLPKHNENRCLIFKEDIGQFGKLMETIVQSYQQEAASEVKAQIMYIPVSYTHLTLPTIYSV